MTNLVRSRSNSNLRNLQREIDRVFDSFFPSRRSDEPAESSKAVWAPRVDLSETDDHYRMELDVPGMTRDDITISYQENQLTVSGERREETEQEDSEYVRVERSFGHFYRSFRLPKTINADDIEATYNHGVLTIEVPKAEESKPHRIEIN
jgi:HSP20 family protein